MTETHRIVLQRLYDRLELNNIILLGARSSLTTRPNTCTVLVVTAPGLSAFEHITELILTLWLNVSYLHGTAEVNYNEYLYFSHEPKAMSYVAECLFDFTRKLNMCNHPLLAKENHV